MKWSLCSDRRRQSIPSTQLYELSTPGRRRRGRRMLSSNEYASAPLGGANAYMFYRCFFLLFSVRHKNTRQPFSGTAERIFTKLLPNDSGENGVCIAVPKWGLKLHIAHLVVTPGEWPRISLLAMALCSYGGCIKRHERVNAFNLGFWFFCFCFFIFFVRHNDSV